MAFWLSILATIGTFLIPLSRKVRSSALFGWFIQFLSIGSFSLLRQEFFPDWQEPDWSNSLVWTLVAWLFLLAHKTSLSSYTASFKAFDAELPQHNDGVVFVHALIIANASA